MCVCVGGLTPARQGQGGRGLVESPCPQLPASRFNEGRGGNVWLEVFARNHVGFPARRRRWGVCVCSCVWVGGGGEQITPDFSSRCLKVVLTPRTASAGEPLGGGNDGLRRRR